MSRISRLPLPPSRPLEASRWILLAVNVVLLGVALSMGRSSVTDAAGEITTGFVVAAGIAATLVAVVGMRLLAFPRVQIVKLQVFALGAQALHAGGHVFRLYHVFWFYDDILHFSLVFLVGMLALELAKSRAFVFTWRVGPLRVGILVWLVATAAAGLWEVFEFTMDVLMGTREQDDLFDTMLDMTDGTLGGALAGVLAYRRVRAERDAKRLADARSDELLD